MVKLKSGRVVDCEGCFFNGGSPDFLNNKRKVLCYRNPPELKLGSEETVRHVYPPVHLEARCMHWRDKRTLETLDDLMEGLK